jgi:spore coat protein CotH
MKSCIYSMVALTVRDLFALLCFIFGATLTVAQDNSLLSNEFYELAVVQEVRLDMLPSNRERMLQALPQRIYVPATFRWKDQIVENVGVRFKGNSSSSPNQKHKRSYLVKFNEYEKGVRFLGLRRAAFDNAIQFGSVFSEPLITEILRDLGLHASRCNFTKLYVNDNYQGVYVNVERIDKSFIEAQFGNPAGPLYKGEGGPGGNLDLIDDHVASYQQSFEAKTKQANDTYDELITFIRAVSLKSRDSDFTELDRVLALDDFFQTMAVMLFSGAFDQLTGWNPHNYYLYQEVESKRWHYLTSDLDVGFADKAFGRIPVIDGWNAAWPITGGPPRPLLEKILANPILLARYRAEADRILESKFRPDVLQSRLDALYELIREDLGNDPFPSVRVTVPSDRGYDDIITSMKAFMERRYLVARKQLDQPGPRPSPSAVELPAAPSRNRNQQPSPGDLNGAPSELRIVSRDRHSIRLEWKDNAVGEHAHIVQRANGQNEVEFINHIGKAMPNVTQAIDTNFDAKATYRYRVYAVMPTLKGPEGTTTSNIVVSKPD